MISLRKFNPASPVNVDSPTLCTDWIQLPPGVVSVKISLVNKDTNAPKVSEANRANLIVETSPDGVAPDEEVFNGKFAVAGKSCSQELGLYPAVRFVRVSARSGGEPNTTFDLIPVDVQVDVVIRKLDAA